jgi:hypothetical protein
MIPTHELFLLSHMEVAADRTWTVPSMPFWVPLSLAVAATWMGVVLSLFH